MSDRSPPIVPSVLHIGEQRHPWRLPTIERWETRYHTPTTLRCRKPDGGELTKHQHQVYCLPDDAAWERAQQARAALQAANDVLADGLRQLGSYARRLAEAGGIKRAPNPLCTTVISAPHPDETDEGYCFSRLVPRVERDEHDRLTSHTPKMLHIERDGKPWSTTHQRDRFVCPDEAAWERIQALKAAAQERAHQWEKLLSELGTYQDALADGRYKQEQAMPAIQTRGAPKKSTPLSPAATASAAPDPGLLSTPLQDLARRYVAARERAGTALLEMAAALAEARQQAQHGEWYTFLKTIGASEDWADRLLDIHRQASENPAFADAVRRNFLSPTTAALIARPSTPPAVVEAVLQAPEPPSKRQVEEQIQKARGVESKSRTGAGFEKAPTPDDTEAFEDARQRFAALGWKLERHGAWFKLSKPDGSHYATTPDLAPQLDTLRTFEASAARRAAAAPAPPLPAITISTEKGPQKVRPTLLSDHLALHPCEPPSVMHIWSISHRPTGMLVAGFRKSESAQAAFAELDALDWSLVTDGKAPPVLAKQVLAILVRYDDELYHEQRVAQFASISNPAPAQLPTPAPTLPAPPADDFKAAARERFGPLLRDVFHPANPVALRLIALGICDRDQRGQIAEMPLWQVHDLLIGRLFAGAWSSDPAPLLALLKIEAPATPADDPLAPFRECLDKITAWIDGRRIAEARTPAGIATYRGRLAELADELEALGDAADQDAAFELARQIVDAEQALRRLAEAAEAPALESEVAG